MATPLTLEPAVEEAQCQLKAQHYLEEMARLREQMQKSRQETEQSRSDTGSLLAQINALFPEHKE